MELSAEQFFDLVKKTPHLAALFGDLRQWLADRRKATLVTAERLRQLLSYDPEAGKLWTSWQRLAPMTASLTKSSNT